MCKCLAIWRNWAMQRSKIHSSEWSSHLSLVSMSKFTIGGFGESPWHWLRLFVASDLLIVNWSITIWTEILRNSLLHRCEPQHVWLFCLSHSQFTYRLHNKIYFQIHWPKLQIILIIKNCSTSDFLFRNRKKSVAKSLHSAKLCTYFWFSSWYLFLNYV